ncbi:MAG: putative flavoprotein involved in transport [Chloroflexota bacterium]|jgi:putative flavoprotein involved in K+ transport|nr:putative flavoprotein involved in transport [Chloroflexota bacterium]
MPTALPRETETVIVGAGQAGLTMSWWLQQAGVDHVLIERRTTLGGGWQDRWDAFRLVSPNWTASFPGHAYDGGDPHGFMPRDEIAGRVRDYAETISAPVVLGTEVTRLSSRAGGGFTLETSAGTLDAANVVVAVGSFHEARLPAQAAELPRRLLQVHSSAYRDEGSLPAGAVLVVGTGQSGVQLAEELREAGREVVLSVGSAGRFPRRYRGHDIFRWLAGLEVHGDEVGVRLPVRDELPDPKLRFAGNPHLSGHRGGHETDLRRLASEGMSLIGRIETVSGERLGLAPDLAKNLAWADQSFDVRVRDTIDQFIDRAGLDVPPDDRQPFAFEPPVLDELDLAAAGVNSVLWTTGFRMNYGWIDYPIFEVNGYPLQSRGVTDVPGLYFLGTMWQHNQGSATLFGVNEDARYLARRMGLPEPTTDWKLPIPG